MHGWRRIVKALGGLGLLAPLLLTGCGKEVAQAAERQIVVETVALARTAPPRVVATTGVAQAYRQADVGFDVGGRLLMVRDLGEEVRGPGRDEDGKPTRGEVIAVIDPLRYEQAVRSAELELEAANAALATMQTEVDEVLPQTITRAEKQRDASASQEAGAEALVGGARATRDNAQRELQRLQKLADDNRISKSEIDQARTAYESAQSSFLQARASADAAADQLAGSEAALAEAKAQLNLRRKSLEQQKAQVASLAFQLERRKTDLEDTQLRAPFDGRITQVMVSRGGSVAAGAPVVRLTLLDPIQVATTVSAAEERSVLPGMRVAIQPEGLIVPTLPDGRALFGQVWQKASVADAATRTFRVDIMMRNWRLERSEAPDDGTPVVPLREFSPIIEAYAAEGDGRYAYDGAIFEHEGRQVLLLLADAVTGAPLQGRDVGGRARLVPVPVRASPAFRTFLSWTFQRVEPIDGAELPLMSMTYSPRPLREGRVDIAPLLEKGVFVETNQWALRPGDLVPVQIRTGSDTEGFWVPVSAITDLNGKRTVFTVKGDRAHAVEVRVEADARGNHRRIEAEALAVGDQLITRGVAYVSDGAQVRVRSQAESAR